MKEFKIGGTVTLSEDEKYIIVDIINLDAEDYYLASTNKKPKRPKVYQRIEENGKVFIDFIEDKEIIKKISNKIIKG